MDVELEELRRGMASGDREAIERYERAAVRTGRRKYVFIGVRDEVDGFDGVYKGFAVYPLKHNPHVGKQSFEDWAMAAKKRIPSTENFRVENGWFKCDHVEPAWVAMWDFSSLSCLDRWDNVTRSVISPGVIGLDFSAAFEIDWDAPSEEPLSPLPAVSAHDLTSSSINVGNAVPGSAQVFVNGVALEEGVGFQVDYSTGELSLTDDFIVGVDVGRVTTHIAPVRTPEYISHRLTWQEPVSRAIAQPVVINALESSFNTALGEATLEVSSSSWNSFAGLASGDRVLLAAQADDDLNAIYEIEFGRDLTYVAPDLPWPGAVILLNRIVLDYHEGCAVFAEESNEGWVVSSSATPYVPLSTPVRWSCFSRPVAPAGIVEGEIDAGSGRSELPAEEVDRESEE